ncbi:MAG TPA: hypothetical protein PKC49_04985 [Phycisphaerae bacterium]|nr:hypothetical protein [Phycisphaerae bacterium]
MPTRQPHHAQPTSDRRRVAAWARPAAAGVALLLCATTAAQHARRPHPQGAGVQRLYGNGETSSAAPNLYRLVKRFDFDERRLGNYEDTPMYWRRLAGPGLPAFNRGRFDHQAGAAAPPSFRLDIVGGGHVCYEYQQRDLAAVAGSDYVVTVSIRPEGLRAARAFMAAFFVDRFDDEIPGSRRVSDLVSATGRSPEPWQLVRVDLPGDHPDAYAVRVQLCVLQAYSWRGVDRDDPDPLIVQDVQASAWFDDLSVLRLPRTRLRLSNAAGFVADSPESFIIEVHNATPAAISAELYVTDLAGRLLHERRLELPSQVAGPAPAADGAPDLALPGFQTARDSPLSEVHYPVPPLPPGVYRAGFRLVAAGERLLDRELQFAVLAPLPPPRGVFADLGVYLGPFAGGDRVALRRLLAAMACGAVKVGVPLLDEEAAHRRQDDLTQLGELLRDLSEHRIETTAVLLPLAVAEGGTVALSTRSMLNSDPQWTRALRPVLTRFGGLLGDWQVGDERCELAAGGWSPAALAELRTFVTRFVTLPRLIRPHAVTRPLQPGSEPFSLLVPARLPPHTWDQQLSAVAEHSSACWLQLEFETSRRLGRAERLADLAQRVILAKASGAQRTYVPAPFELADEGDQRLWQPGEEFLVLRTLFHVLGGARLAARFQPAPDQEALLFTLPAGALAHQGQDGVLAIWTWCADAHGTPVGLHLGSTAHAIDLWGRPAPIERDGDRVRLRPNPMPTLILNVDVGLARLAASVELDPRHVQTYSDEPPPVLRLTNPYAQRLVGEVLLDLPDEWSVSPGRLPFVVEPGQTFEQPLAFTLPPRQWAADHDLGVHVRLSSPRSAVLSLTLPLRVGLTDVEVDARVYWELAEGPRSAGPARPGAPPPGALAEGAVLVVEQTLVNRSKRRVSFSGFADAPGRAQQLAAHLGLAPGDRSVQRYVFHNAGGLRGRTLMLGVRELDGPRRVDQLVQVPE